MSQSDMFSMAHLLRRAGFGATRDELEGYIAKGYEATVEELLNPESAPEGLEDEDLVRRYHVGENSLMYLEDAQSYWMYRMVHTQRPLEEKMALFWHGVFATGYTKLNQPKAILNRSRCSAAVGWAASMICFWRCPGTPPWFFGWTTRTATKTR